MPRFLVEVDGNQDSSSDHLFIKFWSKEVAKAKGKELVSSVPRKLKETGFTPNPREF